MALPRVRTINAGDKVLYRNYSKKGLTANSGLKPQNKKGGDAHIFPTNGAGNNQGLF
jgi:hypothetical protein